MRIDIHQHVWTAPLIERLAAREQPPLVLHRNGLTVLHCAAEQPSVIGRTAQERGRCAPAPLMRDGVDLVLVALSSPAGIESLPREQARELIDAHLDGVAELSSAYAPWGPLALDGVEPDDVDALLARGCVGISLPAGALAGPVWLERIGPVLERIGSLGVPLFVHPGPAPGAPTAPASLLEPLWWCALTDYVAQMQAAWLAFGSRGRRDHPSLTVVFAMLAGGAPLLVERLATRGGPPLALADPLTFYDTSSYGPVAIEAMARLVGERQLVYGSDRPVVEPIATERDAELQANAAELIARCAPLAVGGRAA